MAERTCPICGAEVAGRRDKVYCGKPCQLRAMHERRVADGRKAEQRKRQAPNERARWKSRADEQNAIRRAKARLTERRKEARVLVRRAKRGTKGRGVLVNGACAKCGETFTAWTSNGVARFCSTRCAGNGTQEAKRRSRQARRARERGAFTEAVDLATIYTRDRWTCQLCHAKVAKHKTYPEPMSASLDHVIPLAKGGTHEPANCQLAHLICNSTKSDGAAGEQLRLVG